MINTISKIAGIERPERAISYALWTLLSIALVGSILSAFGICSGACTDAEKYRLFGLRFSSVGTPFLIMALLASLYRNHHEQRTLQSLCPPAHRRAYNQIFDFMLAGAVGAEYLFFYIQKNLIGHYCPVCMIIAVAVASAAALRLAEVIRQKVRSNWSVRKRSALVAQYVFLMCFICFSGLTLAIAGTKSTAESVTGIAMAMHQDIWFGGPAVPSVEVYIITDWLCDYCKKTEPTIEGMLPAVGKVARYTFIDDPIHKESLNFVPYHASLLLNDKQHYIEGRKALLDLAVKSKAPSEEMVKTAFAQHGLTFRMSDYSAVVALSNSIGAFLRGNGVTVTPSIVVRNLITGEHRTLSGSENISEGMVLMTIKRLQGQGK